MSFVIYVIPQMVVDRMWKSFLLCAHALVRCALDFPDVTASRHCIRTYEKSLNDTGIIDVLYSPVFSFSGSFWPAIYALNISDEPPLEPCFDANSLCWLCLSNVALLTTPSQL